MWLKVSVRGSISSTSGSQASRKLQGSLPSRFQRPTSLILDRRQRFSRLSTFIHSLFQYGILRLESRHVLCLGYMFLSLCFPQTLRDATGTMSNQLDTSSFIDQMAFFKIAIKCEHGLHVVIIFFVHFWTFILVFWHVLLSSGVNVEVLQSNQISTGVICHRIWTGVRVGLLLLLSTAP